MQSYKVLKPWLMILKGGFLSPQVREWNDHFDGALNWLQMAIAVVDGKGVSKGFDLIRRKWHPLYPEISGYVIPTLLNAFLLTGESRWEVLALQCAKNLLKYRTSDGGIYYWGSERYQYPIVFDTGQAIFGWISAYLHTGQTLFLDAAMQSGNWLVHQQEHDGRWVKHQHLGYPKVIDARVDWALLELFKIVKKAEYQQAALKNLHWVLQNQHSDGWFSHCGFRDKEAPFTHTLAYTAEGLFHCGKLTNSEKYMTAARKTADALMNLQRPDGSLAGSFRNHWNVEEKSTCLTGNAQMSKLWSEMANELHIPEYEETAKKSLEFVCRTQYLGTDFHQIHGGIAGSYPIYGRYERFKYPSWANKFFIDAHLVLQSHQSSKEIFIYPG